MNQAKGHHDKGSSAAVAGCRRLNLPGDTGRWTSRWTRADPTHPGFCETGAQRSVWLASFWSLQRFGPVQRATWPHQSPTCPSSMRTTLGNLLISLWGMRPCIGDRTRALSRRVSHGLRKQRCCRGECYEKPSSALSLGMHGNGTCRPCVPAWHGPSQRGPFTLQEANPCRRHHTKL